MRKIREVLRLRFQCGQTGEAISAAVGIAPSTVSGYLARAVRAGLTWELAEAMAVPARANRVDSAGFVSR